MVNRSTVIVDCGINAGPSGIVGDVEFDAVAPVVRAISPVPGGVGPVTPMMVLRQTVESSERFADRKAVAAISSSDSE
jgi:methylenetetrahydrofolate dehydrogenase (NADP+) / methenyltetrahydrofolate cyclohydrolase